MASQSPPGRSPGPGAPRAPLKAGASSSSSSSRRRAMTERRVELSNKIRKKSRSQTVALKRRLGAASANVAALPQSSSEGIAATSMGGVETSAFAAPADPVAMKLVDLASAYVRSCRYDGSGVGAAPGTPGDAGCLSALQAALAKSDADGRSIDSLLKDGSSSADSSGDGNTPAFLLCESLSQSLSSPQSTDEVRLDASRVLTNLAATGGGGASSENNYYGMVDERWCDVIVRSSALASLIGALGSISPQPSAASASELALCEQSAWAIGNVGGDSQHARDAARDAGAIPNLIRALRAGFQLGRSNQELSSGMMTVGLCRNSSWALSNLARGTYTSAEPFLSSSGGDGLFTLRDLSELLAAEEIVRRDAGPDAAAGMAPVLSVDGVSGPDVVVEVPDATWLDVGNEVAWIVTFLLAREDDAVEFLIGSQGDNALCESLAYRLSRASEDATAGRDAEHSLRMCIPCVRAVGNAAAACDGRHVARLIQTTSSSTAGGGSPLFSSIPISLARLIQSGATLGGDFATVASEAAWAAGTLLCDAGPPPPHPSTTACDILIPSLCSTVTAGIARLELKREAVAAIGNAAATPPALWGADQNAVWTETLPVRRRLLISIAESDGFIGALTGLLLSFDADAVFAAVQLVDSLLRNLDDVPAVRRLFEEADCPDALERVCDRASAESNYGQGDRWRGTGSASEQSAEIAANIIDDVFEEDLIKDEAEEPFNVGTTETSSGETRYVFGAGSTGLAGSGRFDFSGGSGPVGGQVLSQTPQGRGMGRGRGRGMVKPSWMRQQQS